MDAAFSPYTFYTQRKREHPAELEIDHLETERAKRRYVSEFLSSELTALTLDNHDAEGSFVSNGKMELELDMEQVSPQRRKHVVMITDLDFDASDSEISDEERNEKDFTPSVIMPREIQKSLKKIPQELLLSRTENPIRALVLYQRPPWLPLEIPNQDQKGTKTRKNKDIAHERRIHEIMENGKLSPIPEDPTSPVIYSEDMDLDMVETAETSNRNSYDGYLGDDDEDDVEEMEL